MIVREVRFYLLKGRGVVSRKLTNSSVTNYASGFSNKSALLLSSAISNLAPNHKTAFRTYVREYLEKSRFPSE